MAETKVPWLGPVFLRETIALSRRSRYFFLRAVYGITLLYSMYLVLRSFGPVASIEIRVTTLSKLGSQLFAAVTVTQYLAVTVLVPILVCGLVAAERMAGTLDLLLLTHLSNREIILGKATSRGLIAMVVVASGMPILSFTLMFGGIDPVQLFHAEVATLLNVFYCAAVAIYHSTTQPTQIKALGRTYGFLILMSLLGVTWLLTPNLYFVVGTFMPPNDISPLVAPLLTLIPILVGANFLRNSISRLRMEPTRAVSGLVKDSEVLERELYRRLATKRLSTFGNSSAMILSELKDSPGSTGVLSQRTNSKGDRRSVSSTEEEKEQRRLRMLQRHTYTLNPFVALLQPIKEVGAVFFVVLLAPFGGLLFLGAIASLITMLVEGWLILLPAAFLLAVFWVTFCAATNTMIDADKRFREVLFSTPLSAREILFLLRQRVRTQSARAVILLVLLSILYGVFSPIAALVCLAMTLIYCTFGYYAGTACGLLGRRRNEAVLCSSVLLVAVVFFPVMTAMPIEPTERSLIVFAGATFLLLTGLIHFRKPNRAIGLCFHCFFLFVTLNLISTGVFTAIHWNPTLPITLSSNPLFTLVLSGQRKDSNWLGVYDYERMATHMLAMSITTVFLRNQLQRNFDRWADRPQESQESLDAPPSAALNLAAAS